MQKIKEMINKNKKIILIIGAIIVVAIIVFFSIKAISKFTETEEDKLTNELKELGSIFYEELYYVQQSKDEDKRKESLEKYKDLGIKVNLDTLTRFRTSEENEKALKKFINPDTKEECDIYSSMVTIYPKSPYKKNSYRIEAYLACGFEKTEKEPEKQEEPTYPDKEENNE